jgi:hypothetical protein
MTALPRIGDLVRIPWGFEEVDGEVVDAYDTGLGARVVVQVNVSGSDEYPEYMTVTLPITAVTAA